ncbi:MAG: alpha/beta fold hydrolase [Salibacteraceae bacterium]
MKNDYAPPLFLRNRHLATIIPNRLRRVSGLVYDRIQLTTPDYDVMVVDVIQNNSKKAIVLLHGLEGSSLSRYMQGMAKHALENQFDVIALNFRGCGGQPNMLFRAYHSGDTADLSFMLEHFVEYDELALIGFSLGGNVILKYLGQNSPDQRIKSSVAISAPIDLYASAQALHKKSNFIYLHRFLRQLKKKALEKVEQFPENRHLEGRIKAAHDFETFDNAYTAPAHGFEDALDYYKKSSALYYLHQIKVPSLIINAKNDSFLEGKCYPNQEIENNDVLNMIVPTFGGHVGFAQNHFMTNTFWHEQQTMRFIKTYLH